MKASNLLKNYMLATGAAKTVLDNGNLFIYSGEVPATADTALDMVTKHTELAVITAGAGDDLDFDTAAVGGALQKAPAQTWEGLIDFDGLVSGPGTQTPTFLRFCSSEDSDVGRDEGIANDRYRIQMTCGNDGTAEVYIPDMTDNASNTQGLNVFVIRLQDVV